jgi:hypothetical protein
MSKQIELTDYLKDLASEYLMGDEEVVDAEMRHSPDRHVDELVIYTSEGYQLHFEEHTHTFVSAAGGK